MKKVTILDIANELKLCRNTVAKALNDGPVAYETRMEVVQKAHEMGYSKLRQELIEEFIYKEQEGNKGVILVLFTLAESKFWNELLAGVSDEINDNRYRMQLYIVNQSDYCSGEETLKLIEPDVKGIILLCGFPDKFVKGISKANLPITFFNAPVEVKECLRYGNVVSLEACYAVGKLVEKVIQEGKKQFGFIGYSEGSANIDERLQGMLQMLRKYKIEADQRLLFTRYREDCYFNYKVVEEVIQEMPYIPEVIVCANDDIAKYVATALMKRSMDLAIRTTLIGFDNTIEGEFFKQDILTVEVRKEEVGRRIVRTTIEQIEHPQLDHVINTVATYPILKTDK
ncbi:MAG: substrate-binding domain-containing protein [Lachnospiraceae bacterium]|nr:substrate-binding domain-containing protein [Lachnospiraceae bacterium]